MPCFLQCAIPCFEGLFKPEDTEAISALLYVILSWHALAKLRIHSDVTVNQLKNRTVLLGKVLRRFQTNICSHYTTFETPRETQARIRTASSSATGTTGGKKARTLNILTSKIHAIGDYANEIVRYGPTDIYSTQQVSTICRCQSSGFV